MALTVDPVEIKFLADMSGLKRDMENLKQMVGSGAGQAAKSVGVLEGAFASVGHTVAGLVGVGSIAQLLGSAHAAALDAEKSQRQLSGALKATGHAAGLTKHEIEGLVDELTGSTIFDDEQIREGAAALLRFRNVQGDTFREGLRLAPDLAAALGTNVVDAFRAVGRAIEDPAHGLRGLKTAGVQLSEQQIDLAEKLQKTGDRAGAAKIVIDAMSKSFGGQAAESNQGLVGSTAAAKKAWGEFLESLGNVPQKITGLSFVDRLTEKLKTLKQVVEAGDGSITNWHMEMIGLRAPGEQKKREDQGRVAAAAAEAEEKKKAAAGARAQRELQEQDAAYNRMKEMQKLAEEASKKEQAAFEDLRRGLLGKIAAEEADLGVVGKLTQAEREYVVFLTEITEGLRKITPAHLAEAAALFDKRLKVDALTEARKVAQKQTEDARKEEVKRLDQQFKSIDAVDEEIRKLQEHNAEIGLSKEALAELRAVRMDDAIAIKERTLAQEEAASNDAAYIDTLKIEIEQMKKLRNLTATGAARQIAADAAKEAEEDWKKTAENIERSLTDALMRGFESGKDAGKNLRDTLYNMFRTLVLQPLLKPSMEGLSKGITGWMEGALKGLNFGGTSDTDAASATYSSFLTSGSPQPSASPLRIAPARAAKMADQSAAAPMQVIINNNAPTVISRREVTDSRGRRSVVFDIDEAVAGEMRRPGSASHQALRSGFGAQPVLTGR